MYNRYLFPDDPEYPAKKRLWIRDPSDGQSIFREKSRDSLETWCNNNCQGKYSVGMGFIDFELVGDYTLAVLTIETVEI